MSYIIMNNTRIGIIRIRVIIYSLSIQSITYKCRNNATYEYTSFVAPRHTQRAASQEHNTPTEITG